MPLRPRSGFSRNKYDASLSSADDVDDEDDGQPSPPPPGEDLSGEDASGEAYSAEGSPGRSDAEEKFSSSDEEANSSPKTTHASTPVRRLGMLKGTGPKLLPASSRRPRNSATYNLIALSRQARGYSGSTPKKNRARHISSEVSAPRPRRQSEQPTYNVRELVQQTRGLSKNTQRLADKVATARLSKGHASVGGQTRRQARKRPVSDDSDGDDHVPSKRGRTDPGASIADSFASTAPVVTDPTVQDGDSASKSVTTRPWKDVVIPPTFHRSSALWQTIHPWILYGGISDPTGITDDERIMKMLALPQQRSIGWNYTSRNPWRIGGKIDIVALLMQLTGEKSPSPCTKCTSNPEYGQWIGCMVMSSTMVGEAASVYGCANCVYHGKQTYCSLKSWSRDRASKRVAPAPSPQEKSLSGDIQESLAKRIDQSEASATETATTRGETAQKGHPVYQNKSDTAVGVEPSQLQDTSLLSAGRSVSTLRMEPWEKAPGRIRSLKPQTIENIAFSKSYLANGHEISICKEAAFRVEVIRSGHVHRFTPQGDTTRICSIAAGKLTVDMDGEHPFTIGSHGMFRISPGSGCIVESEIYDDVTVHITSIKVEGD